MFARSLAADAVNAKGEVVAEAGDDVGDVLIDKLVAAGVESIKVRSVLTCESCRRRVRAVLRPLARDQRHRRHLQRGGSASSPPSRSASPARG